MSPANTWDPLLEMRFPRVSGDEPVSGGVCEAETVFSPRERG